MGATLTGKTRIRPLSVAWRLAVLLMVIAGAACDNVEWGGIDIAIVPPPAHAGDTVDAEPDDALPDGPVLFYVHRDSAGATVIPVGQIRGDGLVPIDPGDDLDAFAPRFMDAFLNRDTELALFHRGQRVGTLRVDSVGMPEGPVCRPLPRAVGTIDLASDAGAITEFLALDTAAAPESRAPDGLAPNRGMEVVSDMMAGTMLRERDAAAAAIAGARRQIQPFPLAGSPDPGFTATYLVDDTLGLGGDDTGAALFVVFVPREDQDGYAPAFTGYADYAAGGKAAPRVIDFLDWDDDGHAELLLEVFGTRTSWFQAVGRTGEDRNAWRAIFQDRCDPRTAPIDDTAEALAREAAPQPAAQRPTPRQTPARQPAQRTQTPPVLEIPDIQPTVQLSNPAANPRLSRDTARDTTADTVPPPPTTPPDTVPPDTIPPDTSGG